MLALTAVAALGATQQPLTLQQRVSQILSPTTTPALREILLLDTLKALPDEGDRFVSDALRTDVDSVREMRRQVTEDLLPEALPALRAALTSSRPSPATTTPASMPPPTSLPSPEELLSELSNVFREDPGLEQPAYEVVRTVAAGPDRPIAYELRRYEPYAVAETTMRDGGETAASSETEFSGDAGGFGRLASYLFGGNSAGEAMAMTMPVETRSSAEGETMAFYVGRSEALTGLPAPNSADVRLRTVGARVCAVARFPGVATKGAVSRARTRLLDALAADGVRLAQPTTEPSAAPVAADDAEVVVLQYNPPYTLPHVRRNEIAVAVAVDPELIDDGSEF